MSRRLALAVVALVIVGAVAAVILSRQRGDDRETATVSRGSIDVTIETVGTLQATDAATVRARVAGTIDRLGVAAGDVVQQGDIVVLLEREPFERLVADASARLEQAEFSVQLAEQRVAASPDDATLRLDAAAAVAAVDQATRALDEAERTLRDIAILAPQDGTVLDVLVSPGEPVPVSAPIARIALPAQLELVAEVDELDFPNVRVDGEARFRFDAFPATEITGVVVAVAPQAELRGGATVFATTIAFEPPAGIDLRPGMNAAVTVVTAARDDVLLIPDRALTTVGDRSFVTVLVDGTEEEREVTLGYRSGGNVEVVAGLSEGERVALR